MYIKDTGWIEEEVALVEQGQWRTARGYIVNVEDMSDSHISACIKMLEDKDDYISEIKRDMLKDEQLRRFKKFHDGIFGG